MPTDSIAGAYPRPAVAIPCCTRREGDHIVHQVSEKYVVTIAERAGAVPFLVPALAEHLTPEEILARFDGLLLTGSRSNVEPHHYDGEPSVEGTLHDADRDATTLPLLRAALAAGLPILAICRGIQELNVAMGGTLHQRVHELPQAARGRAPG